MSNSVNKSEDEISEPAHDVLLEGGSPKPSVPPADEDQHKDENDFEKISVETMDDLPKEHLISELLGYFSKNTYDSFNRDPRVSFALSKAADYLKRDYTFAYINNKDAILSKFYPAQIPFLQSEGKGGTYLNYQMLKLIVNKAHNARCRQRFPVPVIICKGKFICRSSTIAGAAEVYGRAALSALSDPAEYHRIHADKTESWLKQWISTFKGADDSSWQILREAQDADLVLLEQLNVGTIIDLMVEFRKTKMGLPVTSSEKAEANNIYSQRLKLVSLPYPGCEFFQRYTANAYNSDGLVFNFNQPMCNAELTLPEDHPLPNLDWHNYKQWDLTTITKNYLKYILKTFQESESGVLVHCISGWDRTPLFISLLRFSLWADGLAHQSLNVAEMVYFVIAYDWFLFGHHLSDRLGKHEDIMLFCFMFLKELASDEFKMGPIKCGKEQKAWISDISQLYEDGKNHNMGLHFPDHGSCCNANNNGDSENNQDQPTTSKFHLDLAEHDDIVNLDLYNEVESKESGSSFENIDVDSNEASVDKKAKSDEVCIDIEGGAESTDVDMEANPNQFNANDDNNPPPEARDESDNKNISINIPEDLTSVEGNTAPVDIPNRPNPQKSASGSCESWQMVSGTGSVRSDSALGSPIDVGSGGGTGSELTRSEKLLGARKVFIQSYFKVISEIRYTNRPGILNSFLEVLMSQP